MCLETIDKRKPKSSGVGWKVFRAHLKNNGTKGYYTVHQGQRYKKFPINKWVKKENFSRSSGFIRIRMNCEPEDIYPAGFHLFSSKAAAVKYSKTTWQFVSTIYNSSVVVAKVRYRKAHTQGQQRGLKVIVADEIFIPKQERGKEI